MDWLLGSRFCMCYFCQDDFLMSQWGVISSYWQDHIEILIDLLQLLYVCRTMWTFQFIIMNNFEVYTNSSSYASQEVFSIIYLTGMTRMDQERGRLKHVTKKKQFSELGLYCWLSKLSWWPLTSVYRLPLHLVTDIPILHFDRWLQDLVEFIQTKRG